MKFRDWFSIKGIRSEMKNVTWLRKKKLLKNTSIVLAFCLVMGVFFIGADALIANILKVLGIN